MTAPRPGSPNHNWSLLGFTVEREPLLGGGNRRTIRRPDGSVFEIPRTEGEDYYTAELRASERELAQAGAA